MTLVRFTVPGSPLPWQRARSSGARRYTSPEQRAYQDAVRWAAIAAVPAKVRLACASNVALRWRVAILVCVPDARIRDTDRVENQIGDALQGVLWHNDAAIVEWHARRVIDRERPRVDVVAGASLEAPGAWTMEDLAAMVGA